MLLGNTTELITRGIEASPSLWQGLCVCVCVCVCYVELEMLTVPDQRPESESLAEKPNRHVGMHPITACCPLLPVWCHQGGGARHVLCACDTLSHCSTCSTNIIILLLHRVSRWRALSFYWSMSQTRQICQTKTLWSARLVLRNITGRPDESSVVVPCRQVSIQI